MHTLLLINTSPKGACPTQNDTNYNIHSQKQQQNITKKNSKYSQQQSIITKFIPNNKQQHNTIIVQTRAMYTQATSTKNLYHQHCGLLHFLLIALSLVVMSCTLSVHAALPNEVVTALKKMKIYPDIVSNLPDNVVTFNVGNRRIKPGENVAAQDLKQMPSAISWGQPSSETLSTLIMLDVDRHVKSANNSINGYVIWTQLNVPGESLASGWPLVQYSAPASLCSATGTPHRLLLLAYHQRQGIDIRQMLDMFALNSDHKAREDFRVNEFAYSNGLTLEAITAINAVGAGLCSASLPSIANHSAYLMWISTLMSLACMLLLRRSVHR